MLRKFAIAGGLVLAVGLSVAAYAGATPSSAKKANATKNPCGAGHAVRPHYTTPIKLSGGSKSLSGAGATFPAPMYSVWTKQYATRRQGRGRVPVDRLRRRRAADQRQAPSTSARRTPR